MDRNVIIFNKDKNQPNARYWQFSKKLKILKNKNFRNFVKKVLLCAIYNQ